jgi:CheY-like chemotaxis protein
MAPQDNGEGIAPSFLSHRIGTFSSADTSPPIATTPDVAQALAAQPETLAPGRRSIPSAVRVLVVDDDPDARDLVAFLLESVGVEVRLASSAADALKELATYTPHVVVSDVGMPGEDGYFLIRRIRALSAEKKNVPAIALTAFTRDEDRARALLEGFTMHMSKPIEPADLLDAIVTLAGAVPE